MADHTPMRYTGKLIDLSDDGRLADFHAVIEVDGEHSTLAGLSREEADQLRLHVGRRVTVTVTPDADETPSELEAAHAAVLASIPRPDAPTADHAPPEHVLPNLSDWQDRIAAVMEAWRGQNGGIFAVNGCALEVAKLFLVGWAGSLAPDASGEQVAAHYNLEDLERKRQAAEVERTERDAELSALRGRVAGLTDTLTMVAWTLGMEVEDGEPIGQLALESAIKRLRESSDRREAQATEAMRMLWLVVRTAGAPDGVTIPLRDAVAMDWSRCALRREDVLGTGDIHLAAVDTGPGQGIPPSVATQANASMATVADALDLEEGDGLADVLRAIDALKERAARVIDRRLEQAITSALGCDETQQAILEAIRALKHQAGQGGLSQHRAMHQQLLDMLGASDHQGAAARIGELAGLELLLTTGGAGRGVTAIAQERRRQIEGERFAPDADQQYVQGELAKAAACYVMRVALREDEDPDATAVPSLWPWARCWWKPKDRRSNLVRAGALIAAELDRMDREAGHG